jgi:hypothetical protein
VQKSSPPAVTGRGSHEVGGNSALGAESVSRSLKAKELSTFQRGGGIGSFSIEPADRRRV